MKRTTFIAAAALLLGVVTSGQAHAETHPTCGPVTQIGKTAYIKKDRNTTWASVKQFVGCNRNYAYIYVWDSAMSSGLRFTPKIVIEKWGGPDHHEPYGFAGGKTGASRQQELWSGAGDTVNECTSAHGELIVGGSTHQVSTDIRC
ncbi:hypothetical protein [Lentzea flava]|uniref:Secreted protein n=1 Tax=Lentzea flava TaxID=103732 RepID=A0ABQ2UW22_9PSEU|nr:hypothetical protein [Lentzea flava]MCP2200688.1 hypothetical protein [Lentzea flava]GGU54864.1 hypothetical protein GCM10010178_54100 [Lentzea flava]